MARCPECNKFVPFGEEPTVEIESYEIDEGLVNIQVNVVLECEECGEELKEATLEYEEELECQFCSDDEFDPKFLDITKVDEESGYMRLDDHDGKLKKPIKFFGCSFDIHLFCRKCNQTSIIEAEIDAESKDFEEC